MHAPEPMNRLLQGDVGAGKTMVALLAALVAIENGLQVAFMAPTEILAEQHAATIVRLFAADALPRRGAHRPRDRRRAPRDARRRSRAATSSSSIGTHALLEEDVTFARSGWSSSTSSIASASCSDRRLREKG